MNNPVSLKKTNIRISFDGTTEPIWSNFYSYEVPSSLIQNAIHLQELHLLKKKVTGRGSKDDDDSKMLLQVRGQEVVLPKQFPEVSTNRSRTLYNNNLRKIRAFISSTQPQTQTISSTDDVAKVREELAEISRFQQTATAQESTDPLYYERMILKTPCLFNRIVTAYNRKQNESARKSMSKPKRDSTSEKRRSVPSFLGPEPDQEALRIIKYKEFNLLVNLSNKLSVTPSEQTYKAYICKGNNGVLVKNILKTRPWWILVSGQELASCNFIWTQWKKARGFDKLKIASKRMFTTYEQQPTPSSFNLKHPLLSKLVRIEHNDRLLTAVRYTSSGCFTFSKKLVDNVSKDLIAKYCLDSKHLDNPNAQSIVNHLEGGLHLHSKKLLYLNIRQYYKSLNQDPNQILPVTFIVKNGCLDKQFVEFSQFYKQIQSSKSRKSHNIWICKPGQNSNRGNGITLHNDFESIKSLVKSRQGTKRSLIIQKYIDYPFLYNKRKFDIRCYLLLTSVNGILKGYWFDEGYIRTSSKQFTLKNIDNRIIHLTNDAVQKKDESYGKFENSNKISFADFQKYLDTEHPADKFSVQKVFAKMKEIATHLVKSVEQVINPKLKQFSFELFGLDFMIDSKFKPYLIEANSNPCLQISGSVLGRLIPQLIQNVIRIAIDPLFPPPQHILKRRLGSCATLETNKFELIFDQLYDHSSSISDRILTQHDLEQPQEEPEE